MRKIISGISIFAIALFSCENKIAEKKFVIDQYSYQLGIIGGFSELVNVGVKKLALSEPMTRTAMDSLIKEIEIIAKRNDVFFYREPDLIQTLLFPEDVAKDMDVVLLYKGNTLNEYLQLKMEIDSLNKAGEYSDAAALAISYRFGKLLSYPDEKINDLINTQKKHQRP